MLTDCHDICSAYPWMRELWLLGSASAPADPFEGADLLLVSDRPPRSVASGQRRRLIGQLETLAGRSLYLHLTSADQVLKWVAPGGRFATAFRNAVRLYP